MTWASSSQAPTLNDDVLTCVFYLNTYAPEIDIGRWSVQQNTVSALDTARYTSQVCRLWRQLILQSPSIWANIVDLGALGDASDGWIEEVTKRTGEAKLSIYGRVLGHSPRMRSFVTSLLDENWHRVRRLDIDILGADYMSDQFWSIFWTRPAPSLEKIFVQTDIPDNADKDRWEGIELFAGEAPLLRRIHFPHFRFDHRISWICQLVGLTLLSPVKIIDTLNLIARCPLLESVVAELGVSNHHDDGAMSWTHHIYLPHLQFIDISSDIVGSLLFLSNVTPRFDSSLLLSIRENPDNLNADIFQDLASVILRYSKSYFGVHCPTELNINIEELNVRVTCKTSDKTLYFGHPVFSVGLSSGIHRRLRNWIIPLIVDIHLSILSPATFDTVSEFEFSVTHFLCISAKPHFVQIFRSLMSVRKITVTHSVLGILNDIQDNNASLFPCLSEVAILEHQCDERSLLEDRLRLFLAWRKEIGNPVRILDMTFLAHMRGTDRWHFLKEHEGLNVVFQNPNR